MKALLLFALCFCSLGANRLDLRGRITTSDGRPISGATAYVDSAGVKIGTSPFCPSCYADCGKAAETNGDGQFELRSLDPELKFHILLIAEGYKPKLTGWIDPAQVVALDEKLDRQPPNIAPSHLLKGRVVGPRGEPVLGAMVVPRGCQPTNSNVGRYWGLVTGVDAMTITNKRGEFAMTCEEALYALDLQISARGLATRNFESIQIGQDSIDLELSDGATITGRYLKDGNPVAGATVGIVQKDRGIQTFTKPRTIGTDADGRFTFSNIAPSGEWYVYGMMDGAKEFGSVKSKTVHVLGNNSRLDVGDLAEAPAHTIRGHVVLSDGKPIPPNTRLLVGREGPWDSVRVILDDTGGFSVSGVPEETIHLFVAVPGYHLSAHNPSLDLAEREVTGFVDSDVTDLTLKLDPGKFVYPDRQTLLERFHQRGSSLTAQPFRNGSPQ